MTAAPMPPRRSRRGFASTPQPASRAPRLSADQVRALRRRWAAALAAIGIPDPGQLGEHPTFIGGWLREAGQPCQADLAREYGVSTSLVSRILRGRAYRGAASTEEDTP